MKRLIFAGVALALVAAFGAGAWYYRAERTEDLAFMAQAHAETFVRPHSPRLGAPDARVFLVEFTDPACETCARFAPFLKQALAHFPEQLQLVVRYAPFHQGAEEIVRILEAARRQDRFWETLDVLYAQQPAWTHNHRVQLERVWPLLAGVEGLDVERVRQDMRDPAIDAIIEQDRADAERLGVRKTPGFFVNGKPLEPFGARPLAELIRAEMQVQYPQE